VYASVQLAPLGQTFPVKVQAVRSVDVRISIPGAVAKFKLTAERLHLKKQRKRLTEDEVFSIFIFTHSGIMYGRVARDNTRPNNGASDASEYGKS
jgi:hypothetical protein